MAYYPRTKLQTTGCLGCVHGNGLTTMCFLDLCEQPASEPCPIYQQLRQRQSAVSISPAIRI
ncbi:MULTISPECIES: hypothetical protein [unclassified Paenibacillus]|uniref:hypothetical protein n=1 Tax=unclassified Paenibacillus TaxID=185978 RepID=UPI0034A0B365